MTKLDALMIAVLGQLEMLSHSAASGTGGDKISHGKPGGNAPPYVQAPHLIFARLYRGTRTDDERRQVIRTALEELRAFRYSRRKAAMATRELRIRIGIDPAPSSVVAHRYSCSTRHVFRCRGEVKRLPDSVLHAAKL